MVADFVLRSVETISARDKFTSTFEKIDHRIHAHSSLRAGMELCNVNDKLFLFGGSGPHAFCFNDLYTFDPESKSWEHCNNFRDVENHPNPKARAGHSMTLVDCKLYIIGGSYG